MHFTSDVTGPLDLGAMMVAFVTIYDENDILCNPPDTVVRVRAENSDWPGTVLMPGDKGTGRCELAPLMGTDTVYLFELYQNGKLISDTAKCDLSLPFVGNKPVGQLHKSFYVRFYEQNVPLPPPPSQCPDCERKNRLLRDICNMINQELEG